MRLRASDLTVAMAGLKPAAACLPVGDGDRLACPVNVLTESYPPLDLGQSVMYARTHALDSRQHTPSWETGGAGDATRARHGGSREKKFCGYSIDPHLVHTAVGWRTRRQPAEHHVMTQRTESPKRTYSCHISSGSIHRCHVRSTYNRIFFSN